MQVLERTHSGNSLINLESWLLCETRCIFIDNEIDVASAEQIKRQIMYLLSKSETEPIELHINCHGGNVDDGIMLVDVINSCPAPIYTICTGRAYSMAAVILACSHSGRRYILPGSETMLHEVLTSGISGSRSAVKAISERMDKKNELIEKRLAKHTGRNIEEIHQLVTEERFFSAEESVENGLCDAVVDMKQFHQIIKNNHK